jgi:hypothetical protein
MREETRARLREHFRASIDRLETLIGRDLSEWRARGAASRPEPRAQDPVAV